MATTRDQYVGLKEEVLSTRMKVRGEEDMEGRTRWMRTMLAEVVSVAFGGMKMPSSRKSFALLVRSREDAEGESRMIGSRRFGGRFCRLETSAGCGAGADLGSEGRLRRNVAAILR